MERITSKAQSNCGFIWRIKTPNSMQDAIDRLAAYEGTGLEPEEIQRMKEYMEPFTMRDIDRFNEIMRAEKDGRLVVLPIPVGAGKAAYGLTDSYDGQQHIVTIECDYLGKLEIWDNPGHEVVIEADGWEIGKSDIGKTVFLTRKEAEAELEKREEADNEAD